MTVDGGVVAETKEVSSIEQTAGEGGGQEKKGFFEELKPIEAVGFMGFGFYLAEMYLIMSCRVVPLGSTLEFDARDLVIFFIFGELFISVLLTVIVRYLTKPSITGIVAVVSGSALLMPGFVALFPAPEIVFIGAWFLAGLGSVCLLALWGYFLAQLTHSKAVVFSALSVLMAGVCLLLVSLFFRDAAWPFANIVFPISSVALFLVWTRVSFAQEEFPSYENVRPHDTKSLLHSSAAMVANSFLLGFGFCFMASANEALPILVIVLAIIVAAVYKIVDSQRKVRYQVGTIISVIAPIAALEFLLLPYASAPIALAIAGVSMLVAMIDEVICWSAVACYMHVYQVHPFANAGFGRIGDVIGLGLGFWYGLASLGAPYDDYVFGLGRAFVVILFVVVQVFFFQDNYKPFTEHSSMVEELSDDLPTPADEEHRMGAWRQNINDFARHYELTARQTEVLMLLAKGYSTSKIEETLVVSNHTVKAHVYSIYQKTDVHSRQELIELIEKYPENQ